MILMVETKCAIASFGWSVNIFLCSFSLSHTHTHITTTQTVIRLQSIEQLAAMFVIVNIISSVEEVQTYTENCGFQRFLRKMTRRRRAVCCYVLFTFRSPNYRTAYIYKTIIVTESLTCCMWIKYNEWLIKFIIQSKIWVSKQAH